MINDVKIARQPQWQMITYSCLTILFVMLVVHPTAAQAISPPDPVVAVHVSEITDGFVAQWPYSSWNYRSLYVTLEESLKSDGIPFVEVSDSTIAAGGLRRTSGEPKYPIVISLASEAVGDNETTPIEDYVHAGGFLLVGSSSFTRDSSFAARGDFSIANDMQLHTASNTMSNWDTNIHVRKTLNNRIVSDMPFGTFTWRLPQISNQSSSQGGSDAPYIWKVVPSGANVLAVGDNGNPLVTTTAAGQGRYVFYAPIQPLVSNDGYDESTYSYLLFRHSIEWAFEANHVPLVRLSPWKYSYDSAVVARHDLENYTNVLDPITRHYNTSTHQCDGTSQTVANSAIEEESYGLKGDYYFSTGILKHGTYGWTSFDTATQTGFDSTCQLFVNDSTAIANLRSAVTHGATIGSHNGGLVNPHSCFVPVLEFWHWGPDLAFDSAFSGCSPSDTVSFTIPNFAGDSSLQNTSKEYAKESIHESLLDINSDLPTGEPLADSTDYRSGSTSHGADWLGGYDNGRTGCGATHTCPRTFVSPTFDAGRDASQSVLDDLKVVATGEQKVGPYPHWAMAEQSDSALYSGSLSAFGLGNVEFSHVSIPVNEWIDTNGTGTKFPERGMEDTQLKDSVNGFATLKEDADYYYEHGFLVNILNHQLATTGDGDTTYTHYMGTTSGVTDVHPNIWRTNAVGLYDWRTKRHGVTIAPTQSATSTRGTTTLTISGSSDANTAIDVTVPGLPRSEPTTTFTAGPLNISVLEDGSTAPAGTVRNTRTGVQIKVGTSVSQVTVSYDLIGTDTFNDDFSRPKPFTPVDGGSWTSHISAGQSSAGSFSTSSGSLVTSAPANNTYGYSYTTDSAVLNGTVESDISFPQSNTYGGGIAARLDAGTGKRYAIWVYPGSNTLKIIKFSDWTTWTQLGTDATGLTVGTSSHHLKLVISTPQSNQVKIDAYFAGTLVKTFTDTLYPYLNEGSEDVEFYSFNNTLGPTYNNYSASDQLGPQVFSDDFGPDDPSNGWVIKNGTWSYGAGTSTAGTVSVAGSANAYAQYYHSGGTGDYSAKTRVDLAAYNTYAAGLGGRINSSTGARYAAWIYPAGSPGAPMTLRLLKFTTWSNFTSLQDITLPRAPGGYWHDLQLNFNTVSSGSGSCTGGQNCTRVRVFYDSAPVVDVTDVASPYTSNTGISLESYNGTQVKPVYFDDAATSPVLP